MQEQTKKKNNKEELKFLFSPRIATGLFMLLAMIFYVIAAFCLCFPLYMSETMSDAVYVFGMGGYGAVIILCFVAIAATIVLTILNVGKIGWKEHIAKYIVMIIINVICSMIAMILIWTYDLHLVLSSDELISFDTTLAGNLSSFAITGASIFFLISSIFLLLYAKGTLSVQTLLKWSHSKRTRGIPFTIGTFVQLFDKDKYIDILNNPQMMEVMIAYALLSKDGQKIANKILNANDKEKSKK